MVVVPADGSSMTRKSRDIRSHCRCHCHGHGRDRGRVRKTGVDP